jgi:hypothetical protein
VLRSEFEQRQCNGRETSIGPTLDKKAPQAFRKLFGSTRKRADFDYKAAQDALHPKEESKAGATVGASLLKPTSAAAAGLTFGKVAAQPSRTLAGFS